MPRKPILIFTFLILTVFRLTGQTDSSNTRISLAYPVYSQYLHNGLIINPAYAGSREVLSIFSSYRIQWAGIDGAPSSATISLHSLLKKDKVGLGLSAQFFQYGSTKLSSVYADYAYHLRLGNGKLSLGLKAGFDMSGTNFSKEFLATLNNPSDPVFTANEKPYFLPNIGAGFYYYNKKFFLGASIPQFLGYTKSSASKLSFNTLTDFDVLISAGALVTFTPNFKFKPSVFIDYSVQKTKDMRIDINGNFIIYDFLWMGASWRTSEDVAVAIIQLQINPQMMFGYSYDYPVGRLNTYSKGSHEIVFRYEFSYKVSASNPRYF